MLTFWQNNKAGFHIDNLEAIKNMLLVFGVDYKVSILKGSECGDIIFKNNMSDFEQNFLENYNLSY